MKWRYLSNAQKLGWVALVSTIIVILFWNPFTRAVILFILPMGSGLDDLIFLVAAIVAAVFGVVWFLQKRKEG